MSEHIEEPWKKFRDASGCGISSINGDLIAEGLSEVDSDRIVLCVNSLAGVPDELLQDDEKNIINRYTEYLNKETLRQADLLAEVTAQRDEMLTELVRLSKTNGMCELQSLLPGIRAAIAKCKVQNVKF